MASALLPSARSARTSGPVGSSSATRSCPSPVTLTCTYAIYDGRKSNVEWPQPLVRQDPMAKRKINCHRTADHYDRRVRRHLRCPVLANLVRARGCYQGKDQMRWDVRGMSRSNLVLDGEWRESSQLNLVGSRGSRSPNSPRDLITVPPDRPSAECSWATWVVRHRVFEHAGA
jgi:hypothetical protein